MLKRYAEKEADLLATEAVRAKAEEERVVYNRTAIEKGEAERPAQISDDDLRMVHKLVKQRVGTTHNSLRKVFRYFDRSNAARTRPAMPAAPTPCLYPGCPLAVPRLPPPRYLHGVPLSLILPIHLLPISLPPPYLHLPPPRQVG